MLNIYKLFALTEHKHMEVFWNRFRIVHSHTILWRIFTRKLTAAQRAVKHVAAEANARNNRPSVARQRSGKHTSA
jgi:hypothetical protein